MPSGRAAVTRKPIFLLIHPKRIAQYLLWTLRIIKRDAPPFSRRHNVYKRCLLAMSESSSENRKALAVGIFYVLGGMLAIVGWPPIIPSVLLGSGIALMVYHFLGGVDSSDRINWSLGKKAAVQVGGASVSLLVFSALINHFLMEWQKDRLSTEPDLEDVIVLGRDGMPVSSLKLKRGNDILPALSWPQPASPRTLQQQPLKLDIDYKHRKVIVRNSGDSKGSSFAYGFLDQDYSSDAPPPLAAIIQKMIDEDFFNPTLVQIRSQICAGANCPVSAIGFPIVLLASSKVEPGGLQICYHRQYFAVAETFAPAADSKNPSLLVQALAIANRSDSKPEEYRSFPIRKISPVEATPACQKANSRNAVIGLMNRNDLQLLTKQNGVGPYTLFATNSFNQ